MDMPTLAALLGHSRLCMVMRYAHPQEIHQSDVKRLEAFNAAKEIAEAEKRQKPKITPHPTPSLQFPLHPRKFRTGKRPTHCDRKLNGMNGGRGIRRRYGSSYNGFQDRGDH